MKQRANNIARIFRLPFWLACVFVPSLFASRVLYFRKSTSALSQLFRASWSASGDDISAKGNLARDLHDKLPSISTQIVSRTLRVPKHFGAPKHFWVRKHPVTRVRLAPPSPALFSI